MTQQLATLIAASLGAVAAIGAVVVTTRRATLSETAIWRRDASLSAAVSMLDSLLKCKKSMWIDWDGGPSRHRSKHAIELLEEADTAFNRDFALLRLVGSTKLLKVAGELAASQMAYYLYLNNPDKNFGKTDHLADLDTKEGAFVNAMRAEFGLASGPLETI